MKTLFYSLFALVLACGPALVSATPLSTVDPEPLIVRSQPVYGGMAITLANLEQVRTTVTLHALDDSNRKLYTDVITNHNGYSLNLNLDKLDEGRYVLSVKKGDTLRKQVILKDANGIRCSAWK